MYDCPVVRLRARWTHICRAGLWAGHWAGHWQILLAGHANRINPFDRRTNTHNAIGCVASTSGDGPKYRHLTIYTV